MPALLVAGGSIHFQCGQSHRNCSVLQMASIGMLRTAHAFQCCQGNTMSVGSTKTAAAKVPSSIEQDRIREPISRGAAPVVSPARQRWVKWQTQASPEGTTRVLTPTRKCWATAAGVRDRKRTRLARNKRIPRASLFSVGASISRGTGAAVVSPARQRWDTVPHRG